MCGIDGVFRFDGKLASQKTVEKMTEVITHRGPDDQGFLTDGPVGFGFRRLAILDLSPAGHQPMSNEKKEVWVLLNGEAYNYIEVRKDLEKKGYKFHSSGDTEVILKAYLEWGPKFIEKFNGMWGLAIWDSRNETLFIYRDRMGVKPVYYYQDSDKLYFASEIKSLLQNKDVPKLPNDQVIFHYLTSGLIDYSEETFFKEIRQLPAGHFMTVTKKGVKTDKYWDLDPNNKLLGLSDEEYSKKFYDLFEDSVRLRLRSDVPVGTCLSGGLDSSSIAMVVNKLLREEKVTSIKDRQKTFTSAFENKKYDERRFSDEVIKSSGVDDHYVFPDPKKLMREVMDVVWHQDEPFGSTSIYAQWNVFRKASEEGMKVMLDGQGADELLGGYHPYYAYYFSHLVKSKNFIKLLQESWAFGRRHGFRYMLSPAVSNPRAIVRAFLPGVANKTLDKLVGSRNIGVLNPEFVASSANVPGFRAQRRFPDSFKEYLYKMMRHMSLPALLKYEDRDSMAFSIEARVPFLDYRIVEYVFSLPNDQLLRGGTTKYVLRQAMRGTLSEKIRTRQDKMGFVTPEDLWFRNEIREPIRKILASKSFAARKYFNQKRVLEEFDRHLRGEKNLSVLIWRWVNLELWLRRFIDVQTT